MFHRLVCASKFRRKNRDTFAYLCVLLGQSGSQRLERELGKAHLVSSVLLVLEATRTLVRLARDKALTAEELQTGLDRVRQDVELFELRDLTLELCLDRNMPTLSTPRSLDPGHLRTALWFHAQEPLHRFVSLDKARAVAARELGLPV